MTPDPLSPVGLVVRTLQFAGIMAAVGAAGFRLFILVPLSRRDSAAADVSRHAARAAHVGLTGAILVLVAALARLVLQAAAFRDPLSDTGVNYRVLLLATTWGQAWLAQVVLAAAALAAFRRCGRGRPAWTVATLVALMLAFTPAFSGHAIGSERAPLIAVLADGLHVLGAGCWIGSMAVLAAGLLIPRQSGNHALALVMIAAFSPLGLSAAATVAASGVVSAALHLGSLEALVSARYGRTLLVKVGMVLAVVALGAFNWKRAGRRVIQQADERPMLRSIKAELAVSLLVLLATAVLVVTPPPGEE